jgi:hypothetical protein
MFSKDDLHIVPMHPKWTTPKGLHDFASGAARAHFADTGEFVSTFFIAAPMLGGLVMVVARWQNEFQKEQMCMAMRGMMAGIGTPYYTIASEIWIAAIDPKDEPEWRQIEPRLRPDRTEGLMVATADATGELHHQIWEIKRKPGRPPSLSPDVRDRGFKNYGGRMTELLMSDEAIQAAAAKRDAL